MKIDFKELDSNKISKGFYPAFKGPERLLRQFGQLLNNAQLTSTVISLYKNATAESSRRTARCGVNHFKKFTLKYFGGQLTPIANTKMSLKGLLLCFFAGALFLDPKKLAVYDNSKLHKPHSFNLESGGRTTFTF